MVTSAIKEVQEVEAIGPTGKPSVRRVSVATDLTREYKPASDQWTRPWQSSETWLRELPNPIDDLTSDFGYRIYDKDMLRDPQTYSTLSILVMAVLVEHARVGVPHSIDQESPEFTRSETMSKFVAWTFEHLNRPLKAIMFELTEGMLKLGHKVGEQIYETRTVTPSVGPQLILIDIKARQYDTVAFVTDRKKNVKGMTYVKPGFRTSFFRASTGFTENGPKVLISRRKFVIPTHKSRDGDPRGSSHMRPVYIPWWKKQQVTPEHLAYLSRFAQPSLHEALGPGVSPTVDVKNEAGDIISSQSTIEANNTELMKMRNGAVKTSPYGSVLSMLEAQGGGGVFLDTYDHEDRQIAKGVLMQTLTTEEGRSMARAASRVHQDIFGVLISYLRDIIEWTINREVIEPLIEYNYGVDALAIAPVMTMGDIQAQDIPDLMRAIAALLLAGGMHESQLPPLWQQLGLPPADMKQWAADAATRRQSRDAAAQAATTKATADASATAAPTGGTPNGGPNPGTGTGGAATGGGTKKPGTSPDSGSGTGGGRATGGNGSGNPNPRPRSGR